MRPRDLQYRMPAEWEKHERTYISWPVRDSMVHPGRYEDVCRGYAEIVHAIAEFEPVTVVVNPEDVRSGEREGFGDDDGRGTQTAVANAETLPPFGERIGHLVIPHNDAWLRDNGPTFLVDGRGNLAGVNWRFNAWGGKYAPWDLDDAVAPHILEHAGARRFDAPLVMEGGSFHTDGEGTLITTEECLLNPNRNPHLSREEIEDFLRAYLNVERIIWLKRGLSGDETDGHVDNIASFAAPGKVLLQVCGDPGDENYGITQENLDILRQAVDAKGRRLEIIPVEQPPAAFFHGKRLTLSYLNFYFVNGGIILPVFGGEAEETDRRAIETFRSVFPDRTIRTVDGMAIVSEGGNVHCTTQQMPQAAAAASGSPETGGQDPHGR